MSEKNIIRCIISVMLSVGAMVLMVISVYILFHTRDTLSKAFALLSFLISALSVVCSGVGMNKIVLGKSDESLALSFQQQTNFVMYGVLGILLSLFLL